MKTGAVMKKLLMLVTYIVIFVLYLTLLLPSSGLKMGNQVSRIIKLWNNAL
jgi:hypothetical protein